ncbi:lipase lipl-1-like isoform X1 [Periplaneta americana]|uniref:lipase lipl-1-like isoform X1 n=1 Tax=Periplaneta americana TaxID=6978 RepID=UPI0037E9561B
MTSLAPVAFMKHVASPLVQFSANFPGAQLGMEAIELLGVGELMPSNAFMQILADVACSEGSVLQPMCENILFLLVGYDPSQLNETLLPVILSHTPAGYSTEMVAHYAQEISAVEGGFRLWDFYAGNLAE